jgi:hypothetical protein
MKIAGISEKLAKSPTIAASTDGHRRRGNTAAEMKSLYAVERR